MILSGDKIVNDNSVHPCEPQTFVECPHLESALRDGAVIHCFRSGGGLRVVRLEKPRHGELIGYGEHPYIEQAFSYCDEDYRLGGQDYATVYGTKYPHYMTGCSTPSSEFDRWVLSGRDTDFDFCDGKFRFTGKYSKNSIPREVHTRVATTRAFERFVDERGYVYMVSPSKFPNGELCSSAHVIERPKGCDPNGATDFDHDVPVVATAPSLIALISLLKHMIPFTW